MAITSYIGTEIPYLADERFLEELKEYCGSDKGKPSIGIISLSTFK